MPSVELLMPAGNFEKMKIAIAFGADAVYLGIPRFSLRARENGFKKTETIIEAIEYAHAHRKKVYITANILPHNHKVDSFIKYAGEFLKDCQPDAWIMSDAGLIMLMKEHYPEQIIHLSVQANTVNFASAKFWGNLGIRRIILSRELSITEMQTIKKHCPNLELEAFVHGSICIAYSGRCLISNYMASRDPNQGTCANSCRWQYKILKKDTVQPPEWKNQVDPSVLTTTQHGDTYAPIDGDYYLEEGDRPGEYMQIDEDENGTYLMNARDLCAIEYLEDLHKAGVMSFKVEGRSKSVYYTALTARAYRHAVDDMLAGKPFNPAHLEDIFATSNRGLIAGFLKGNPGHTAQAFEDGRSQASSYRFSGILRKYDPEKKLMNIEIRNSIKTSMSLEMIRPNETKTFTVASLYNEKGNEVPEVHGGAGSCWIPFDTDPGEFVLFREKLN